MSLVFTFLGATNQSKGLTLGGALDFHKKKIVGWKGTEFEKLDKAKKKDFTKNTSKKESTQAFAFWTKGEVYMRE